MKLIFIKIQDSEAKRFHLFQVSAYWRLKTTLKSNSYILRVPGLTTGIVCYWECMYTKFVWESKGGFVKAAVRRAVLLGEGPLTDCPLYY